MLELEMEHGFAAPADASLFVRNSRYFAEQISDNVRWAARMGVQLADVLRPGTHALDFGCGHGALSVEGARLGARVTGIDTSAARIGFAARKAATDYPELAERLRFLCCRVQDFAGAACFDAILSKDSFEHIGDIDGVLAAFRRLLIPGGRLYLGFSPLWYSPFGDHGFLTRRRVPWLHLLLGEKRFLAAHNAHTGRPDRDVEQAGFNRLMPQDFRAAFRKHGFAVERMRVNPGSGIKRVLGAPLHVARHIPPLEPFATIGLYVTLRCEL
jgi:SAM-dependent methyltransferase